MLTRNGNTHCRHNSCRFDLLPARVKWFVSLEIISQRNCFNPFLVTKRPGYPGRPIPLHTHSQLVRCHPFSCRSRRPSSYILWAGISNQRRLLLLSFRPSSKPELRPQHKNPSLLLLLFCLASFLEKRIHSMCSPWHPCNINDAGEKGCNCRVLLLSAF